MGNEVEYLSSSNLSRALSLYHCGFEICQGGHSFGPAIRAHYLFHFITKGMGKFYASGQCFNLSAGQGFLIVPGQSTYYLADLDNPWTYSWFGFDGYEAKTILADCGMSDTQLVFNDDSNGMLEKSMKDMTDLFSHLQINEYATLGQLYTCFSHMKAKKSLLEKAFDQTYSDKATDFIYHNFSYDIKISDVANYIGIDRTYLYKIFMNKHKVSPQKYLIQFRLNVACSLLEKTKMNITEIAYSCGFKDMPSFYKHFKVHYAQTPVEYRKNQPMLNRGIHESQK